MIAAGASLDTALAHWELHARPELPTDGFALVRPAGRARRGVHRTDGTIVIEPDGHVHRITPSPDGTMIAAEWAADADELGVLAIIDVATGTMRVHPEIRLRYDTVLWAADSTSLEVVASRDAQIIALDVRTGAVTATPIDPETRVRFFPGGRRGLIASRGAVGQTVLVDRDTGITLGRYDALFQVLPLGGGAAVRHGSGIDVVGYDGATRWRWNDRRSRIVDLAVHRGRVVVLTVRAGRSELLELRDAAVVQTREVAEGGSGDETSATGIRADGDVLRIAVEGPVTPPQIVTCDPHTLRPAPTRPLLAGSVTTRSEIRADDGATIVVHVTTPPGADGPMPLILTCYGGFGVPFLPTFEPTIPAWLEHGGAYASAQVRGGGEQGSEWWDAGRGEHKHRTVDDLGAVAGALVQRGITTPALLVLVGASLGGTIVASCAYRHPRLCAGVVATAAPLDLLRLDRHPLGAQWKSEFGDDGTALGRSRVERISPLALADRLTPGVAAPEFLGIVLEHDTRVDATDTVRMAEALRLAGVPASLWTARGAGHGANELTALHGLGLTVLQFAARLTTGSGR